MIGVELEISSDGSGRIADVDAGDKGVFNVLTFGVMYLDTKDTAYKVYPASMDVELEKGETRYLRLRVEIVSFLRECDKSGKDARLCKAGRRDLIFEDIPEEMAKEELITLQESVK